MLFSGYTARSDMTQMQMAQSSPWRTFGWQELRLLKDRFKCFRIHGTNADSGCDKTHFVCDESLAFLDHSRCGAIATDSPVPHGPHPLKAIQASPETCVGQTRRRNIKLIYRAGRRASTAAVKLNTNAMPLSTDVLSS